MRTAIARSLTLCSFEPVKYCSAAPMLSGGTTRRSIWTSATVMIDDRVSPAPSTCLTIGNLVNVSMTATGWVDATRMSMSPVVSFQRRMLPAGAIDSTAGILCNWRMTSSPPGSAIANGMRCDRVSMRCSSLRSGGRHLRAQPRQRRHLAAIQRFLEIVDGLHAQLLRELHGPLGSDAGDLHQHERCLGYARSSLLERPELAGAQILANLGPDALADAVDLLDAAFGSHDLDRFVMVLDARRRVAVVGDAIAVLTEQLHSVSELAQTPATSRFLTATRSARAAKMASNIGTVSLRVKVFC